MTGAPDARDLRSAIAGLIGFAAAEEQALLMASATRPDAEPGTAQKWPAVPVVAHNTEFKAQQAARLRAIAEGRVPPAALAAGRRPGVLASDRPPGRLLPGAIQG